MIFQQALNKVTLPFEWMEKGKRCSYSKVTNKNVNATAQFLYSQLGSNLITQKQSDFGPEDFFIREEWSGGLGHCNWIRKIQVQAP